jgi:excisionase family DNA binding protein
MNQNKKQNILTVEELADLLRVEKGTIYKLVKAHKIPAFKIGRVWRFNFEEVSLWMRNATISDSPEMNVGVSTGHSGSDGEGTSYAYAAAGRNGSH